MSDHLTSDALAAFVDGRLTGSEREHTVRHLAGCGECRQELAELRAVIDTMNRPGRRRWVVAAAAAAAILAMVTISSLTNDQAGGAANVRAEKDRLSDGTVAITVVSPADGATISPGRVQLSWHAVGDNATYTVTVQDSSGSEVWRRALSDTSAAIPDSIRLFPGLHFWSVDARLTDGTTAKTGALSFIVR